MSKDNLIVFNTRIEAALHKKLKLLAATTGISIQEHLAQAIREYLEKQSSKKND